jgi:isopenicillin N synthase-like dioxygenase
LNDYLNGTLDQRKNFSEAIGSAFNETGFVTITNHGLNKELITKLYEQVQNFFSMPEQQKLAYEKVELAGQRGYTSKGREKAKDSKTPDLKEFWQTGQYVEDGDVIKAEYPDNVIVNEYPEFNEVTKCHFCLFRVTRKLF